MCKVHMLFCKHIYKYRNNDNVLKYIIMISNPQHRFDKKQINCLVPRVSNSTTNVTETDLQEQLIDIRVREVKCSEHFYFNQMLRLFFNIN